MAGADSMQPVRLVAGLGNPGREYLATRHNAGFWFADALAARLGAMFRSEGRFHGHVAKAQGDLRLLKPATFMNLSGRSVAAAARFFGIAPGEILAVHDELDLLPGEAKMKFGGGIAGHNGLRDIAGQLGTKDFWRLRLGIGHPGERALVSDYVLHVPRQEEADLISGAIERSLAVWPLMLGGEMEKAMHRLHTQPKD
jgi:peptidyl-tRNA hydrolase, PTH1 family